MLIPNLIEFIPNRFVGGDDPATSIQVLLSRIECLERQEQINKASLLRCMNFIGAAIRQQGGDLRLPNPIIEGLPQRFAINFTRAGDDLILTMVEFPDS